MSEIQPSPEAYEDWYNGLLMMRAAQYEPKEPKEYVTSPERQRWLDLQECGDPTLMAVARSMVARTQPQYEQLELEYPCPKTQLPGAFQTKEY